MENRNNIVQSINGPIRLAVIAFYKEDPDVDEFLKNFRDSLINKNIIVVEKKFEMITNSTEFFRELPNKHSYNCIMLVTHGEEDGAPKYQETENSPGGFDHLVKNPYFLSLAMHDAAVNRLVFLAICYTGKMKSVQPITKGKSSALYVVTPAPGTRLTVLEGAKAMALFLDTLVGMKKERYEFRHLKRAEEEVVKQFANTIKLWDF